MKLYDGNSPITWVHDGYKTIYDMTNHPKYGPLAKEPCVIFDNGRDEVYSFRTLHDMCMQYGVKDQGDTQTTYAALVYAMNPNMPSIDERVSDCEMAICELYETMGA